MASLKARCYTVTFLQNLTKPKCYFGIYFTKPKMIFWHLFLQSPKWYCGTYFYKAQMLLWHLFLQSPNDILAPFFTKPKCYFGTYFTKPDIILAPIFTKLKYYFGKNNYIILKSPKLFLGKNISSYTKIPNLWEI